MIKRIANTPPANGCFENTEGVLERFRGKLLHPHIGAHRFETASARPSFREPAQAARRSSARAKSMTGPEHHVSTRYGAFDGVAHRVRNIRFSAKRRPGARMMGRANCSSSLTSRAV